VTAFYTNNGKASTTKRPDEFAATQTRQFPHAFTITR
jgi:hypothetical protein